MRFTDRRDTLKTVIVHLAVRYAAQECDTENMRVNHGLYRKRPGMVHDRKYEGERLWQEQSKQRQSCV